MQKKAAQPRRGGRELFDSSPCHRCSPCESMETHSHVKLNANVPFCRDPPALPSFMLPFFSFVPVFHLYVSCWSEFVAERHCRVLYARSTDHWRHFPTAYVTNMLTHLPSCLSQVVLAPVSQPTFTDSNYPFSWKCCHRLSVFFVFCAAVWTVILRCLTFASFPLAKLHFSPYCCKEEKKKHVQSLERRGITQ